MKLYKLQPKKPIAEKTEQPTVPESEKKPEVWLVCLGEEGTADED